MGEVGGHWRGVQGSRRDTRERAARRDGADGRGPLKTATDPPRWRQTQGGARGQASEPGPKRERFLLLRPDGGRGHREPHAARPRAPGAAARLAGDAHAPAAR